jgi:hypothetical protein
MANQMLVWAEIGKPNQRERLAPPSGYARNDGQYPEGYVLLRAPGSAPAAALAVPKPDAKPETKPVSYKDRLWKGWVLPASDADAWFVAGAADYHHVLGSDDLEKSLSAQRAKYRGMKLSPQNPMTRLRLESAKGVLFLDALRRKMGDDAFLKLMTEYFTANSTKAVTAQSFLDKAGVKFDFTEPADGPAYLASDINHRLATAVIVYGTVREAGANRYAAEQMQARFLDRYESRVPIYKDFEVSDALLRDRDVVFIGRPEANSALAAWAPKLSIAFEGASFKIDGDVHASERETLPTWCSSPQVTTRSAP